MSGWITWKMHTWKSLERSIEFDFDKYSRKKYDFWSMFLSSKHQMSWTKKNSIPCGKFMVCSPSNMFRLNTFVLKHYVFYFREEFRRFYASTCRFYLCVKIDVTFPPLAAYSKAVQFSFGWASISEMKKKGMNKKMSETNFVEPRSVTHSVNVELIAK